MPIEILTGALALVLYFVLAPRFNNGLYRRLLFFPARFPRDWEGIPCLEGIDGEDVFFTGENNQRLNGWYFEKPDSDFVILFNHGNSGNLTIRHHMSRLMIKAGYSVFVYDYQGFGRSTGLPTVDGICSDGLAAYDYLVKQRGIEPERIILYGESLGAAVATYLSTLRQCSGLVLQSGFASLRRVATEHFPLLRIYPAGLFPLPPLDSLSTLEKSDVPLLLIHGKLDRVIPVRHSHDMHRAAGGIKRFLLLPGTAHGDIWTTAEDEYIEELSGFPQHFRERQVKANADEQWVSHSQI